MKTCVALIFCVALAGCCTQSPVVIPPSKDAVTKSPASGKEMDAAKKKVEIDPYLLEDCPGFSNIESSNPTPGEVLFQKKKDVVVLNDCAKRHRSLVEIVKKAFNLQ